MSENTLKLQSAFDNIQGREDNDYYSKDFRLISAGIPIKDSNGIIVTIPEQVLKDAIMLMDNKLVHLEHDTDLMKWIGKIVNPVWEDATPERPAGINATVMISRERDSILKAGIVKALQEGIIKNGSLGFSLEWVKSHPDMKTNEFFSNMGKDVDGAKVQFIATKITHAYEYSLAHQGSDPYAMALSQNENNIFLRLVNKFTEFFSSKQDTKQETIIQNEGVEMAETELDVKLQLAEKERDEKDARIKELEKQLADVSMATRKATLALSVESIVKAGKIPANDSEKILNTCLELSDDGAKGLLETLSGLTSPLEIQASGTPLEKSSETIKDSEIAAFLESKDGKAFLKLSGISKDKAMTTYRENTVEKIKLIKGVE